MEILNVIVISTCGTSTTSFVMDESNKEEKIAEAEKLFAKVLTDNGYTGSDLATALEDGYAEDGNTNIYFTYSDYIVK